MDRSIKTAAAQEHLSPSGRYKLVITSYATKPGCWDYTRGLIYAKDGDEPIFEIQRNYNSFPFLFIDDHPNGHPYFVGGSDYQGQTIIELDTGKRLDVLPPEADDGHGFCWAVHMFDAGTQILIVDGCYWAAPYEFRFYDFSDPMSGWPELENEVWVDADNKAPTVEPDGTIKCYKTESSDDDDEDDDESPKERPLAATKTFRREGLKLVLVEEWVSEKEKERRIKQEESSRKYNEWLANFKATDPLYVLMKAVVDQPPFQPEGYFSIGQTHDQWHPTEKFKERRMCRRIQNKGYPKIDIEWGTETAPIKLIVYRDGKHSEDLWFEHSAAGMTEALAHARTVLR